MVKNARKLNNDENCDRSWTDDEEYGSINTVPIKRRTVEQKSAMSESIQEKIYTGKVGVFLFRYIPQNLSIILFLILVGGITLIRMHSKIGFKVEFQRPTALKCT